MLLFTSSQAKQQSQPVLLKETCSLLRPSVLNYLKPANYLAESHHKVIPSSAYAHVYPSAGEILLYCFLLTTSNTPSQEDLLLLSPHERKRALSYRLPVKGARFTARRAQLRRVLALALNVSPLNLVIHHEPTGRPQLVTKGTSLFFSLSYEAPWCVIALSQSSHIGIDIQQLSSRSQIAFEHFFSKEMQYTQLDATQIWVRMEAIGKMTSQGLNLGMRSLFSIATGACEAPSNCYFVDFKLSEKLLGTVCVKA